MTSMMKLSPYDVGGEKGKIGTIASDCWEEEIKDEHVRSRNGGRRKGDRMREAHRSRMIAMYR